MNLTRYPVLSAFVIAAVLCAAATVLLPFNAQEAPWALTLILVAFPFLWFLAWVFINTFAWWRETTGEDR